MHPLKKPKALLLHQSEIDESPSSEVDSDYINHLKAQCAIRYNALKTAENLISAYQKENQSLKAENQSLKERLHATQEKLKAGGTKMEVPEKVQYFQRINELLESIIEKDQRIADLEKEGRIMQERMAKEGKLREEKRQREVRQRQGEERDKYSNYLRTPVPEDTFSSIGSRSSYQKSSAHVLEGEVRKKDAEIMALLRRLRDVEEQLKSRGKKERLKTSDTLVNKSIRKNTYSSIEEN